jgi:hypothetical protein
MGGDVRPTLRGLVKGVLPVSPEQYRMPCVVFGDKFSSWLPCLGELGFRAVLVVLSSDEFVSIVSQLVDSTCRIDIGLEGASFNVVGAPMIGFFDGRLTSTFLADIHGFGLSTLVATRVPRRPFHGWLHRTLAVPHSAVGGVTLSALTLYAMTLEERQFHSSSVLPPCVQRDASTILQVKVSSSQYRPAPSVCHLVPLECRSLGPVERPYYHGGGLLPRAVSRKIRVLTPTLFAPLGSWGLRSLSHEEVLLANDWPSSFISAVLSYPEMLGTLAPLLMAGKCLVAGFRAIFGNGGGCFFSGGSGRLH